MKHTHKPEPNGWYTTGPNSSWNAECSVCHDRIVLVTLASGQQFWRARRRTAQSLYPASYR